VNGTPGNALLNNASVMPVLPCSYGAPQANPRLGIGQNMECFGNEGPGSLWVRDVKVDETRVSLFAPHYRAYMIRSVMEAVYARVARRFAKSTKRSPATDF
jgi:hypothetical protein